MVAPSDRDRQAINNTIHTVRANSGILGQRLNLTALGFGTDDSDFTALKTLITSARVHGAGSSAFVCWLDSSALKTLFSSADTLLTKSRSALSRLTFDNQQRELAVASEEQEWCLLDVCFDRSFDPTQWSCLSNSNNGKGQWCKVTRTTLEFREEAN
eukprot:3214529-Rhodomonas_salina.4